MSGTPITAAVFRETGGPFSIERMMLDEPRATEVLVKLVATGLCHTDLGVQLGEIPLPPPWVLGHEGAGFVVAVGAQVVDLAPGDPVVLAFATCGTCRNCDDDHVSYCEKFTELNLMGRRLDGTATVTDRTGAAINASFFGQSSFATHALAEARNVVKVTSEVPLELLGPFGCGFMTGAGTVLNVLRPTERSTIAVLGTGAVGCAAIMAAKIAGAARIVAIDRVADRLEVARDLGATDIVDTSAVDLGEALAAVGGIDGAVDTTGVPRLIEAVIPALRSRGTFALLAVGRDSHLGIDMANLTRGRVVTGVTEGDVDPQLFIPQLIQWYRDGRFPIERIIRNYPFERINDAAADALSGAAIKPVLLFS